MVMKERILTVANVINELKGSKINNKKYMCYDGNINNRHCLKPLLHFHYITFPECQFCSLTAQEGVSLCAIS